MALTSLFVVAVLGFFVNVTMQQECPVNLRDGSQVRCYFPNIAFNNWENTRRTCKMFSRQGNLAVIDTPEKMKALISSSDYFLKGDLSLSFWIGLKYLGKNKGFYWVNGQPLGNFQPWATINKGELRSGVQNCVALNLYTAIAQNASADQGAWHIDDCQAPRASLCETPITSEQYRPQLSELVAMHPEKASGFFEKQPAGHSCTHGVDIYRFNSLSFCSQMCLVHEECAGYIVPLNNNATCVLKSDTCRSTFADPFNTFYKKNVAKITEAERLSADKPKSG